MRMSIETHNLDTQSLRVEFSFKEGLDSWTKALTEIIDPTLKGEVLKGLKTTKGFHTSANGNIRVFSQKDGTEHNGYLVVNLDELRAQYWLRRK